MVFGDLEWHISRELEMTQLSLQNLLSKSRLREEQENIVDNGTAPTMEEGFSTETRRRHPKPSHPDTSHTASNM